MEVVGRCLPSRGLHTLSEWTLVYSRTVWVSVCVHIYKWTWHSPPVEPCTALRSCQAGYATSSVALETPLFLLSSAGATRHCGWQLWLASPANDCSWQVWPTPVAHKTTGRQSWGLAEEVGWTHFGTVPPTLATACQQKEATKSFSWHRHSQHFWWSSVFIVE